MGKSKKLNMRRFYLIFKRIFRLPFSNSDHDFTFFNSIKNSNELTRYSISEKLFSLSYKDIPLNGRLHPHSDCQVLKQVLLEKTYKPAVDFLIHNILDTNSTARIIDAGSNVGYSSIYFVSELKNVEIVCIEPSEENAKILETNLSTFIRSGNVSVYLNALADVDGVFMIEDKKYRDGKDWSFSVKKNDTRDAGIESICIKTILDTRGWDHIDLLKIDIEGSERYLFANEVVLEYLSLVKIIAIEIHDEFVDRELIYNILKENNYLIFNYGETTLAVNLKYLNC